jgi:hypothetical protein
MSYMEHTTASQPPVAQADTDTDTGEQDRPQIRSLITPGLMSVPHMPAWLRKLLRRTDTPATR